MCSKLPTFQIQINNYRPHMSAPPYQSWLLVSFLDSCVPPVAPLPTSTLRAGLWPQENPIHNLSSLICLQNRSAFSCFSAQLQPTDPLEGTSILRKKAVSQSFLAKQMSCSSKLPHSLMTSHTHVTVLVTGQEGRLLPWLGTSLHQEGI